MEAVAELLRVHGRLQSLMLAGKQDVERWLPLDLSIFCGLRDLRRFSAYVFDVGRIPECWGEMELLESFYCTNCMMTAPPTALRGSLALRSFVAFRQSEMTPCVYRRVFHENPKCRLSWESKALLKGNAWASAGGRVSESGKRRTKSEEGGRPNVLRAPRLMCWRHPRGIAAV